MKTNTAPWDYQTLNLPAHEVQTKAASLTPALRKELQSIFVHNFMTDVQDPLTTAWASLTKLHPELEPDDCGCVLPEQSCPACRSAAVLLDGVELPYQEM